MDVCRHRRHVELRAKDARAFSTGRGARVDSPRGVRRARKRRARRGSLLAPVRKYAGHPEAEGRCSTFEATVALFRALGLPGEECKALLENVKVKVDAVLAQKNMPSAYGRGKDDLWPGGWAEAAGPPGAGQRWKRRWPS